MLILPAFEESLIQEIIHIENMFLFLNENQTEFLILSFFSPTSYVYVYQ